MTETPKNKPGKISGDTVVGVEQREAKSYCVAADAGGTSAETEAEALIAR
jgi:hypothetical protein